MGMAASSGDLRRSANMLGSTRASRTTEQLSVYSAITCARAGHTSALQPTAPRPQQVLQASRDPGTGSGRALCLWSMMAARQSPVRR